MPLTDDLTDWDLLGIFGGWPGFLAPSLSMS